MKNLNFSLDIDFIDSSKNVGTFWLDNKKCRFAKLVLNSTWLCGHYDSIKVTINENGNVLDTNNFKYPLGFGYGGGFGHNGFIHYNHGTTPPTPEDMENFTKMIETFIVKWKVEDNSDVDMKQKILDLEKQLNEMKQLVKIN